MSHAVAQIRSAVPPKVITRTVNGRDYYRVANGYDDNGNLKYESFARDREAAEKYVKTLEKRAESKRRAFIDGLTVQERADVDWSLATMSKYGHTIKEAVEWFEKTK